MFFIITALAAIVVTIIWHVNAHKYKLSLLCFIYWGATLMWLADHVIAYLIEGGDFFEFTLDAALLGVAVVILGLAIWLGALLIKDPKKDFPRLLRSKN